MDFSLFNILISIGAGLASVLSPCVLPVVPVIMAGADHKDRLRPLLIVLGLSITFMLMGAVSSLFGSMLAGKARYIELGAGIIILLMGLMILFDMSIFKRLAMLSNIQVRTEGRFSGLIIGLALGLIWVPCVGPVLSSILAMAGTSGQIAKGIILLGFYSIGFSIPLLIIAYSSQIIQNKLRSVMKNQTLVRYVTGGILAAYGLYIIIAGNIAF
ncbi:MAG: cytochrome c biogenesis CcdA family protein [Dissulfurispiraceae bacterium]|jgi:cytochrome c-type biogenesis protein|nr:cytochrome c biogenesis CcdA family protein [Dissulfurispiraceae bacterium]